jgi:hypothetical protein
MFRHVHEATTSTNASKAMLLGPTMIGGGAVAAISSRLMPCYEIGKSGNDWCCQRLCIEKCKN